MSSVALMHNNVIQHIPFKENDTLLQVFQNYGISIAAPCGGNGKCGKCLVKIIENGEEKSVLACKQKAYEGLIVVYEDNTQMNICEDFNMSEAEYPLKGSGFAIAVDLGTTTVAAELVNLSDGKAEKCISKMNDQKPFGADVITRTQYTMDNPEGLSQLCEIIRKQISSMCRTLCNGEYDKEIEVFVAGNTIMEHIMAGLSPASIAVAPFTPFTLFHEDSPYYKNIRFSPCISGYVGGDITAGILSTQIHKNNKNCFLIDLGTNGEMALSSKGEIVCCSVASGPAFEGAGIECGCASIKGAINHFEYNDGKLTFTTIDNATPVGICGSGIIELTAILLKLGIVDGSGYLQPPDDVDDTYGIMLEEDEDGNGLVYITSDRKIFFCARDVRQIQLAKAAVASGISILLEEAGLTADDVDTLYLAGGFGTYIDVLSASEIGMLDKKLADKTTSVGNSSLAGAALAASSDKARDELYSISTRCRYIELSNDPRFNDYFTDNMAFSDDF